MGSVQHSTPDQRVEDLLQKINEIVPSWRNGNHHSRADLIATCTQIVQALENPSEALLRMSVENSAQLGAIETAQDLGLFERINVDEKPKSTARLAEEVGADPALLIRLLRVLASISVVKYVSRDEFGPTKLSKAFAEPSFKEAIKVEFGFLMPAAVKVAPFLGETKYQNPWDPRDGAIHFTWGGRGTDDLFAALQKRDAVQSFQGLMKVWTEHHVHWSDEKAGFYPVQQRLVNGARTGHNDVFLVDIGGGQGNDMVNLLRFHKRESLPGRLILEDLPNVIDTVPAERLANGIETIKYDYFTPQPIRGARTYFMHSIIHDHSIENAKKILRIVADAMEPGYSKFLIFDQVLVNAKPHPYVAGLDWRMMIVCSAQERFETEWKELLENPEVGLKVVKIWHYSTHQQSVIEAELA